MPHIMVLSHLSRFKNPIFSKKKAINLTIHLDSHHPNFWALYFRLCLCVPFRVFKKTWTNQRKPVPKLGSPNAKLRWVYQFPVNYLFVILFLGMLNCVWFRFIMQINDILAVGFWLVCRKRQAILQRKQAMLPNLERNRAKRFDKKISQLVACINYQIWKLHKMLENYSFELFLGNIMKNIDWS